jgi:hypothetical protein
VKVTVHAVLLLEVMTAEPLVGAVEIVQVMASFSGSVRLKVRLVAGPSLSTESVR